jgi:radical SAM protein with 4Fe4S-binding SPASM domain
MSRALSNTLERCTSMAPVRVQFELTEACNLMCRFCYNSQFPVMCRNYLSIIDRLVKEKVMEIVLTGGEPMAHPNFLEIVNICSEKFATVQIQTNGTFITDDVAKHLEQRGIQSVNVSLHGSPKTNDYLTKVAGSYQKAVDGMKSILKTNIMLATNFVITSKNFKEFPAHFEKMYALGIRNFSLSRFTPTGVGCSSEFLRVSTDKLIGILRFAESEKKKKSDVSFLLANSIPMNVLPDDLRDYCNYCHFGSSRFYIDVNGNLLMCGMSRLKIGNIFENAIMEIKEKSDTYKLFVSGDGFPQSCLKCKDFARCRGGCRAAAISVAGNYFDKDPLCSRCV